jgi:hypothetical protein
MSEQSDRLTVTIQGAERELFMPFAMLSELTQLCPDVDNLGALLVDPELRAKALITVLSDRDAEGKITAAFSMAGSQMTTVEVNKVLDWILESITDFFVQQVESASRLKNKYEARVLASTSSRPGSPV